MSVLTYVLVTGILHARAYARVHCIMSLCNRASRNRQALELFRESVEHDVSNSVPTVADSKAMIRAAAAAHAPLLQAFTTCLPTCYSLLTT